MKPPTTAELRELTAEQRLELLEAVWDTLTADPDSLPQSTEHHCELDTRLSRTAD
jgi:putative addiction module component (TIGR02574 family)